MDKTSLVRKNNFYWMQLSHLPENLQNVRYYSDAPHINFFPIFVALQNFWCYKNEKKSILAGYISCMSWKTRTFIPKEVSLDQVTISSQQIASHWRHSLFLFCQNQWITLSLSIYFSEALFLTTVARRSTHSTHLYVTGRDLGQTKISWYGSWKLK